MPVFNPQEPIPESFPYPSHEFAVSLPSPEARASAEGRWQTRLVDLGERLRVALRSVGPDPEPRALRDAAELLERDGGVVFADLDGWPRPPALQGFVPDLYAVFEDREILLSFVNERSALGQTSIRRDRAFTAWAQGSDLRIYEQVLVEGGRGGRG